MKINITRNVLYRADIPIKQSAEIYDKWYADISDFLFEYLKDSEVTFLSSYSPDKSIGDEFCEHSYKIKTYDNTFYYYKSTYLSKENIDLLVSDSEFNLGNIILINGTYDIDDAGLIALCWEKELITSDIEIFKLGNDGYTFYCYNADNQIFDKTYQKFLSELKEQY